MSILSDVAKKARLNSFIVAVENGTAVFVDTAYTVEGTVIVWVCKTVDVDVLVGKPDVVDGVLVLVLLA